MEEQSKNEKILVTGGAGYVGSLLVPMLLDKGYQVRVLDNLMYRQNTLLPYFIYPNFHFEKADVRDEGKVKEAMKDADYIVHLAAIVGEPACKKDPEAATAINYGGTLNILKNLSPQQKMIFASTGSVYGKIDGICTEDYKINPLSVYAVNKADSEKAIADKGNFVTYRFATAFGLSPRPRLDLLVNDFVWKAMHQKSLIIYEAHFKRTFIHVRDMGRSFVHAIENFGKMKDHVYNVGSEEMNFTKEDIARAVKDKIDFWLHFADFGTDPDQRNYEVSYAKIRNAGYKTTIGLDRGIDELIHGYKSLHISNPYSNIDFS